MPNVDYAEQAKVIGEYTGDWFKPTPGTQVVKFLSEGEPRKSIFEGKEVEQLDFEIEVHGKKYKWSVTKGKTYKSLYGQLMLLGQNNQNRMFGLCITLMVKGTGKDVDYTVVEAVDLIPTTQPKEDS